MLEATLIPREVVIEFLDFFTFYDFCHFILSDPDANSEPNPKCIPVPLGQKVFGSSGSGSTTLDDRDHYKRCEL
jgi:hypothetical protein